jgi:chromate reductase, NAD(P)H dehydrogenase (quinone)
MISIISGTNRPESLTYIVANTYLDILKSRNVSCNLVDLRELPADFIISALYENSGSNELFNAINDPILKAEKFVFIVPEYNGSFPGVLKAFIDGLKYPESFQHKKAALVGISSGIQGAVIAMSHLTDIFNYLGMNVLAFKPKLHDIENNVVDGKLIHKKYQELLERQADLLLSF